MGTLSIKDKDILTELTNLANLYKQQDRYDEAIPLYKQRLELQKVFFTLYIIHKQVIT